MGREMRGWDEIMEEEEVDAVDTSSFADQLTSLTTNQRRMEHHRCVDSSAEKFSHAMVWVNAIRVLL
jgi:hypothetical protein